MTTAIASIQRTHPKTGTRSAGPLRAAVAALGTKLTGWSAKYYETTRMPERTEGLSRDDRMGAALRWHARHGRPL